MFDVSDNSIGGKLYVPAYMCCVFAEIHSRVAGELPKELWDLVNLTVLWLNHNQFRGELYVPAYMRCMFTDIFTCFAGELPKELGNLVNLTYLYLDGNEFQGEFVCSTLLFVVFVRFADIPPFCLLQANCPRSSATSSI